MVRAYEEEEEEKSSSPIPFIMVHTVSLTM